MGPKISPANKLTDAERAEVLAAANSQEFRDVSPKQIVPILADRGMYLASEATFYRILREEDADARTGSPYGVLAMRPFDCARPMSTRSSR